ncbi:hypothetical protein ACJX0J_026754 [Zea mays]
MEGQGEELRNSLVSMFSVSLALYRGVAACITTIHLIFKYLDHTISIWIHQSTMHAVLSMDWKAIIALLLRQGLFTIFCQLHNNTSQNYFVLKLLSKSIDRHITLASKNVKKDKSLGNMDTGRNRNHIWSRMACLGISGSMKMKEKRKPRVVWSVELHRKFVAAVNQLGIDSDFAAVKNTIHAFEGLHGYQSFALHKFPPV